MADEPKKIPNIRTLKTDAEIFMREKKISQLDVARGAYTARDGLQTAPAARFSYRTIIAALVIIAIIGAAGYFAFRLFSPAASRPTPASPEFFVNFLPIEDQKTIIFSESNPGALVGALLEERGKNLRFDTVIYFPIQILKNTGETKLASSEELIRLLSWNPPADFLANLVPDFNAVIVYGQNSRDLALIFKVKNFARALASLLQWEEKMWFDWKPFLGDEDVKNIAQFSFRDDIIKNNDARVLKNGGGKIILGYSIFNKQHVIISTSREALSTILDRLIALPPR